MNSAPAIAVTGLRKAYADKVVLDGLDLTVPQGTVFALLGPNGAGKTTTVDILSTLTRADGGEARIAGHDLRREPDAVRSSIALTGQFSAVDDLLTGAENLRLMADTCISGGRRAGAGPPTCWPGSTSPTPPTGCRAPTPAACAAAWTSRWA